MLPADPRPRQGLPGALEALGNMVPDTETPRAGVWAGPERGRTCVGGICMAVLGDHWVGEQAMGRG